MAVKTDLKIWEKKKAPEVKKPEEIKNVGVTEEKEPRPVPPPQRARFMSEVKIPGK